MCHQRANRSDLRRVCGNVPKFQVSLLQLFLQPPSSVFFFFLGGGGGLSVIIQVWEVKARWLLRLDNAPVLHFWFYFHTL